MWRPDIGKYTGHLQEPADPKAIPIKDASCNVIPQMNDAIAAMGGPLLRAWQNDPFNKNAMYFTSGYDTQICTLAMTNAVGAAWVTKPGPLGKAGYTAIPLYEGVAPTTHVTSTECGNDCAFISKKMMATALVGGSKAAGAKAPTAGAAGAGAGGGGGGAAGCRRAGDGVVLGVSLPAMRPSKAAAAAAGCCSSAGRWARPAAGSARQG